MIDAESASVTRKYLVLDPVGEAHGADRRAQEEAVVCTVACQEGWEQTQAGSAYTSLLRKGAYLTQKPSNALQWHSVQVVMSQLSEELVSSRPELS